MSGMDVVSDQVLHIPQAPKGLQMAYSIHIHISWAQWTIVLRYIRPFWSFIHVPAPSQSGAFWTPRLTTKRIFIDTLNGVGPVTVRYIILLHQGTTGTNPTASQVNLAVPLSRSFFAKPRAPPTASAARFSHI